MTANDTDDANEIPGSRRDSGRSGVVAGFRDRTDSSADSRPTASRSDETEDADRQPPVRRRELFAPLAIAAAYVVVAVVLGRGVFDTGADGYAGAVALSLLGLLLLVSGWTTARLYDDAEWIAANCDGWTPEPLTYEFAGAAVLVLCRALEVVVTGRTVARPGLFFAGNAVVALAIASIVSGPAYAVHRDRRLDRD